MHTLELTIEIDAPQERVWSILAEHERMPEWMPVREVIRRRPGSPEPDGVGAIRTIRGGGLVVEERVLGFEAPKRLEYELFAGAPVRSHRGEVRVEADNGRTRVTWSVRFRPLIPGTGWLLERELHRTLAAGLAGLRHLATTGEAPYRRGKMRRSFRLATSKPTF